MEFQYNECNICTNPIIDRCEPHIYYYVELSIAESNGKWFYATVCHLHSGGYCSGVDRKRNPFNTQRDAEKAGWKEIRDYLIKEPKKYHCYVIDPAKINKMLKYANSKLVGQQIELF